MEFKWKFDKNSLNTRKPVGSPIINLQLLDISCEETMNFLSYYSSCIL